MKLSYKMDDTSVVLKLDGHEFARLVKNEETGRFMWSGQYLYEARAFVTLSAPLPTILKDVRGMMEAMIGDLEYMEQNAKDDAWTARHGQGAPAIFGKG